ncbi:hypothetical protein LCGC14_0291060 [marine sediment metagenome]|uniref:protein-glutamate O-methyltransferase n=1 Tax=marine sediment metagenome TaxID=412755 RepID=A0A0F9UAF7_9ZZZZ
MDDLISELKRISGLQFEHYQRKFLEKRISFRMKYLELNYYQEYIDYLNAHTEEIDLFLDKFTINYTFFFRNINVYWSLEKFLKIYCKNLKGPLRIWSAPCATGDEPYSIAILLDNLKNAGNNIPNFEIVASDIDKTAIKFAKRGIYSEYAIHETPKNYVTTYFSTKNTEIGPKYKINQNIKDKVNFFQEDIIKGHRNNKKFDIIFCRNFIIYINQFAREKLMRILEARLKDGGLLILGGSETFSPQNTCFESISIRDRFYVKNLSSQKETFKQTIREVFQTKEAKKFRKILDERRKQSIMNKSKGAQKEIKKHTPEKKIKNITRKKDSSIKKKVQHNKVNKKLLNNTKRQPAEVRITGLVVNNNYDGNLSQKNPDTVSTNKKHDIKISKDQAKINKLKQLEESLKNRELMLEKRNEFFNQENAKLENKRKNLKELLKNANEKEKEVNKKILEFKHLKKRLEKREQVIEQRERQLQDRFNQVGQYSKKIIQREIQININSTEIELKKKEEILFNPFDEKRYDRVEEINSKKELIIPSGYYGLINSFDQNISATKLSIEGLGSSIALILKDPINNIFAMAHISLPNSSASKQGYHLLFPHTFADTSVKDLFNNLVYHGAKEPNISAVIVGGAKLFLEYDKTYQENIETVKNELKLLEIKIEAEDIGGLSERSIYYDTINDTLFVKKSWEFQYRAVV